MECCNKLIHSSCLSEWLKRKNNCPCCRTPQSPQYNSLLPYIGISQPESIDLLEPLTESIELLEPLINWRESNFSRIISRNRRRRNAISFGPLSSIPNFSFDEIINNNFIENIENEIEHGISFYINNNNIGVTYINENPNYLIGITSLNVESNNDIFNININRNRNINLNINNTPLLQVVNNIINDLDYSY